MGVGEFITPEGFRLDGRRVQETRNLRCAVGAAALGGSGGIRCGGTGTGEADGCAIFELGGTKAIAYVHGPMELRRGQQYHDRASLSCVFTQASVGLGAQKRGGRVGDRHSQEKSLWIQQTFEHAIMLDQFPRSQIRVHVHLLQSDGSGITAAINAASLALADAGIPMRDLVCSCSSGVLGKGSAVDLNRDEEMAGGAQVVLAMLAGTRKVSLMEIESKVPDGMMPQLYEMALNGCEALAVQMKACLQEHLTQSFSLRMSLRSGLKN